MTEHRGIPASVPAVVAEMAQKLGEISGELKGIRSELLENTKDTRSNRNATANLQQTMAGVSNQIGVVDQRMRAQKELDERRMKAIETRIDDMEGPVEQFTSIRAHTRGLLLALVPVGSLLGYFSFSISAWISAHFSWK